MIKIIIVLCMLTVGVSATVCTPDFFGKNRFLDEFITYQLLNLLAVILTVTLASIANIHLALNRVIRSAFKNRGDSAARAERVRAEINQNGWALVALFVLACLLIFLKGSQVGNNTYVLSFVHSMGAVVLLTNLLVLCDIYQVVFAVVRLEGRMLLGKPDQQPESLDG